MDQDAFRNLLSKSKTSRPAGASGTRGSFLPPKTNVATQQKASQGLQPDFKPRHLKKKPVGVYRDRATERREGAAGDFAEVEAVLESFEKQHPKEADHKTIEQQRQYLGGDAEHTVLVKGLDFALLEQQKARTARESAGVDDDALESAFLGVGEAEPVTSKTPDEHRKRTREEIIEELKNKRSKVSGAEKNEAGLKPSNAPLDNMKFKPLGFKPIGSNTKNGKEPKKKRKKVKDEAQASLTDKDSQAVKNLTDTTSKESNEMRAGPSSVSQKPSLESEPEPISADFDIFAGVGEYEGVDFDDDAGPDLRQDNNNQHGDSSSTRPRKKWFDDEPELESSTPEIPSLLRSTSKGKASAEDTDAPEEDRNIHSTQTEDHDEMDEPSLRLAPLTSSAVPSIRDILAADSALEAEEGRKARKEKRKAGGKSEGAGGEKKKVTAEAKLNRDYQKLQSYQAKKKDS